MPRDIANGSTEASAKTPGLCGTTPGPSSSTSHHNGPSPSKSAPQLVFPIRAAGAAADDHPDDDNITTSTARKSKSTASVNTTQSAQSHKEYLDSLAVPSGEELARLSSVQQRREKAKKAHVRELKRRSVDMARGSAEARRDFVEMLRGTGFEKDGGRRSLDRRKDAGGSGEGGADADAGGNEDIDWAALRAKAATLIQRTYRGYRVRREMRGLTIDAGTRWTHAIRDARWKNINTPRAKGEGLIPPGSADGSVKEGEEGDRSRSASNARQNWKKAAAIVKRAGGDEDSSHGSSDEDDSDSDSGSDGSNDKTTPGQKAAAREKKAAEKAKRQKKARVMGLQYFLEMVDLKHRYGSNLRQYHAEWKKADTNENFFYWLDYGAGRYVELTSCPRDRLDRECVRYLSREERMYYLVNVDKEGRLCWAKNGARIDTTEEWRDSIHGIVPKNDPTPAFAPAMDAVSQGPGGASKAQREPQDRSSSSDSDSESDSNSTSASESKLEAARAAKYATPSLDDAKGLKKVRHVSAATIFNKLLRKSVKKNTWIFVADTSFRLYVGIKDSGAFQHSSFLQGSRISAAGLIKIKNGRLASLSPLSGHYRPPASNFRAFVHSLRDEGVDMSHVSISKSYAVLVGLEAYVKTRRKGKETLRKLTLRKDRLVDPEGSARREEQERDKSESAAKERAFLERERFEAERGRREREGSRREDVRRKLGLGSRGGRENTDGDGQRMGEQGQA